MEWIIEHANKSSVADNASATTASTSSPQNVLKLQTAKVEVVQSPSEIVADQNESMNAENENKNDGAEEGAVGEQEVNSLKCDEYAYFLVQN
jgi:hypothetical protein